jgi:hypothetical protein
MRVASWFRFRRCVACRRTIQKADARWIVTHQGVANFTVWFCCDCAEVEADAVLIELLGTADDLPLDTL